jgi:hypothetical protein
VTWAALALAGASSLYEGLAPSGHGSIVHVVAFNAAFALLVALVAPRPRSHLYSTLVGLLVLGFWTKFLLRQFVDYPFLEPIGDFSGTVAGWNSALDAVIAGVAGVASARLLHLSLARRARRSGVCRTNAPTLYVRYRRILWFGSAAIAAAAYVWNAYAAVYITGVNTRVTLPFGGNAALSWLYLLGLPMWMAALIEWERRHRRETTLGWSLLWIPLVEAVVNAGSLLSRASFLLRMTPYWLAQSRGTFRIRSSRTATTMLLGLGFCLSLTVVMTLRSLEYANVPAQPVSASSPASPSSPPAPGPVVTPRQQTEPLRPRRSAASSLREVGTLVFDRWTGMEGVLAVAATQRSFERLRSAVGEDPAIGVDGVYQRIAHARYKKEPRFTFLTLAGAIAMLSLAGSLPIVAIGMCAVTSLFMAIEGLARVLTGNEAVCAVASVGAAFAVSQVTFPRLLGAFTIELLGTTLILGVFSILLERSSGLNLAAPGGSVWDTTRASAAEHAPQSQ